MGLGLVGPSVCFEPQAASFELVRPKSRPRIRRGGPTPVGADPVDELYRYALGEDSLATRPQTIGASPEFESLFRVQVNLLRDLAGVRSCELFFRSDTANGGIEFRRSCSYGLSEESVYIDDGGSEVLASVLSGSPYQFMRDDEEDIDPDNREPDFAGLTLTSQGGLSAPLLYSSVVIGLLVVESEVRRSLDDDSLDAAAAEKGSKSSVEGGGGGDDYDAALNVWTDSEARLVGRVAATLASAAALDQKAIASSRAAQVGAMLPMSIPSRNMR